MKWMNKPVNPPKVRLPPKFGDKRHVRKFAWFWTRCGDFTVWLEHYISVQEFRTVGFLFGDWVEIQRTVIEKDEKTYL